MVSEPFSPQLGYWLGWKEQWGTAKAGQGHSGTRFEIGTGGDVVIRFGVRSISAGVAALGIGFAVTSAWTHASNPVDAGLEAQRTEPDSPSPLPARRFEERYASASFDDRFSASFDQAAIRVDEGVVFSGPVRLRTGDSDGAPQLGTFAARPQAQVQAALSVLPPPRPTTASLASPARAQAGAGLQKPVQVAYAGSDDMPLSDAPAHDPVAHTAVYDISAHVVYLPNGERLEAHSGLGGLMDDARAVSVRHRGPTPPNVYNLSLREKSFHGVQAIRLTPVGDGNMFGRDGMLAHPYMLGPNGQSNGCVSFADYPKFLNAFRRGDVDKLVVVEHLADTPGSKIGLGWIPQSLRNLFRTSQRADASPRG